MKYIEHTFKGRKNELLEWQDILGGTIKGNTLHTIYGIIQEYVFHSHTLILVRIHLKDNVFLRRIVSESLSAYPIVFSESLTFIQTAEGEIEALHSKSDSIGIYFSNSSSQIHYPKEVDFSLVLLRVPPESFSRVLSPDHIIFKYFQNNTSFVFYESISSEMKSLMSRLLNNNLPSGLLNEFAYVRSWELFLCFINKFFYQRQNKYKLIDRSILQQLNQIREYIISDLSSPKNIEELTRFSGMGATKLRTSFKEVYGMSIYAFFQEHRMERARDLLVEEGKCVSEVAYMLGYSHLGHFTAAFKQKFNCLPKDLKMMSKINSHR